MKTEPAAQRVIWLLALVVGGGLIVLIRVIGLWWGLPNSEHYFSYHPDEIFLLLPSFGFAQGDWNPHFFNYGTLYIYLVGIPAVVLGLLPDAAQFPAGLAPLYLLGRIITALLGLATVAVLYLALRGEHEWLARTSALLLAMCPLHVVNSYYATVDVPATFFLTLASLLALRATDRPHARAALPLGLAVGLAAASKYNAGLFVIPALLAPVLARRSRPAAGWWLGVPAGAAVGFLIGCPFFWTREFLQGLLFELEHAHKGGTLAFVGTGSGWTYHLLRGLPVGLGYALLGAVVLGVVAAIRLRSPAARLSLLWVVLYLFLIGFSKERFIRYLVPVTPFMCVLAASAFRWLMQLSRSRLARSAVDLVFTAAGAATLLYTLLVAASFLNPPQDAAWDRIAASMSYRSPPPRIGLAHVPWFFHPPVSPFNAGLLTKSDFEAWNAREGAQIVVTGWDAGALTAERPHYFFLSDLESRDLLRLGRDDARRLLSALEGLYTGREIIAPNAFLPHYWSWLAPPRSWAPPDWLYPSPVITMYYNPR